MGKKQNKRENTRKKKEENKENGGNKKTGKTGKNKRRQKRKRKYKPMVVGDQVPHKPLHPSPHLDRAEEIQIKARGVG